MSDSSHTSSTNESTTINKLLKVIKKCGQFAIGDIEGSLEVWRDVEINIGVTGGVGAGKSSFINAIRGFDENNENAAEVGVDETTEKLASYFHPKNKKITFWDLPGFGTRKNQDLEIYCQKFHLENYDTILILCEGCFTQNDCLLTEKVKAMEKPFIFVRTKIDQDISNENRKSSFNENAFLSKTRQKCVESLQEFGGGDEVVFLISNHKPDKWDFALLTVAILDGLTLLAQQESLALSLDFLTTKSKKVLKRKVDILRGRIWKIATLSFGGALIPVPGVSITADLALLAAELNFYKSQLGLPEENSSQFQRMSKENQEKFRKFCGIGVSEIAHLLTAYTASSTAEEFSRFIPLLGIAVAGSISFASTYNFLQQCLNDLEKTALDYLSNEVRQTVEED